MSDQQTLAGFEPNRERYARLSKPLASMDAANEALRAFHEAVADLREKHGITEFVAVCSGTYLTEDGEVSDYVVPIQYGDASKAEGLAAWLYGHTAAGRDTLIANLLRQGKKSR